MEPTATRIRDRALKCKELFRKCERCDVLGKLDWIQCGQGDFNLWSFALSATATGKSSLDFRVRERSDVQRIICGLLEGLDESLRKCLKIVSARKENLGARDLSDGVEDDPLASSADEDEEDGPFAEQIFDIKTILDQLIRIHVAIRKSGAKLRHHRADSGLPEAMKLPDMMEFKDSMTNAILFRLEDRTSIADMEEKGKPKNLDSLDDVHERLVRANLVRRNRIYFATEKMRALKSARKKKYQEQQEMLRKAAIIKIMAGSQDVAISVADPQGIALSLPDTQGSAPLPPRAQLPPPVSTIGAPSEIKTATDLASDFGGAFKPNPAGPKKPPTVITVATQTCGGQDYPTCPKRGKSGGLSSCPYCAELLDTDYETNRSRWRGHLANDLHPYVCIFPECSKPDELYATTELLAKHVKEEHGVKRYICGRCSPPLAFEHAEDWEIHTVTAHGLNLRPAQLKLLARVSMRTMVGAISCPLCSFSLGDAQPELPEHIVDHLHRFALRSLPWGSGGPDRDSESGRPAPATSSEAEDDMRSPPIGEEPEVLAYHELETDPKRITYYVMELRGMDLNEYIPANYPITHPRLIHFESSIGRLAAVRPSDLSATALEYGTSSLWKMTQWYKELQNAKNTYFDIRGSFDTGMNVGSWRDLSDMIIDEVDFLVNTWEDEIFGFQEDVTPPSRDLTAHELTLLDWLSRDDPHFLHHDFTLKRINGVGNWLFEKKDFKDWVNNMRGGSIFYPGSIGSGKSFVASLAIDHLLERFKNEHTVGVAYVYCDYRRKRAEYINDLIRTLLEGLLRKHAILDIPGDIKEAYARYRAERVDPSPEHMVHLLVSLIKNHYERCFVIIDALDECAREGGAMSFLSDLCDLMNRSGASIFITARPSPLIQKRLIAQGKHCGLVTPEKNNVYDDIRRYLVGSVQKEYFHPSCLPWDHRLRDTAQAAVVEAAATARSFRIARIYHDAYRSSDSIQNIDTMLTQIADDNFTSGLESLIYKDILERIEGQPRGVDRDLAEWILRLAIGAFRPLTNFELETALKANDADSVKEMLNETDPPSALDRAITVCYGLLEYCNEKEGCVIRFVHSSAKAYLRMKWTERFPNAHAFATKICFQVLHANFSTAAFITNSDLEQLLGERPFCRYAVEFLEDHCRMFDDSHGVEDPDPEIVDTERAILRLLRNSTGVTGTLNAIMFVKKGIMCVKFDDPHPSRMLWASKGATGYHFAAFLGLRVGIRSKLEDAAINAKDGIGRTPLHWAARKGHEGFVYDELFHHDARHTADGKEVRIDADSKDFFRRTPLSLAAENGHIGVVKQLLARDDVNPDSKDLSDQTPLLWAAKEGHDAVVTRLLATETVNPDSKDEFGQTPLYKAAENGHENVVSILVSAQGVDLNARCNSGGTPLSRAAENGYSGVVRILLAHSVSPNTKDYSGGTPLSRAAENGHKAIVEQLLAIESTDVHARDLLGRTALDLARKYGHTAVAKLLEARNPTAAEVPVSHSGGRTGSLSRLARRHSNVWARDKVSQD